MSSCWLFTVTLVCLIAAKTTFAYTIPLQGGAFYGPGNRGVHYFTNGHIRNVEVRGLDSATVPFANNGEEVPNTLAEKIQGGPVDGILSDGTLINENDNGAFVIELFDPYAGYNKKLFIGSVMGGPHNGVEELTMDIEKNLDLRVDVGIDAGDENAIARLVVSFTTGTSVVNEPLDPVNGHRQAGPFYPGEVIIGRAGDFDQDGFLDGVFVASLIAPEGMIGAGDPVIIIRSFRSDVGLLPMQAALLTINGIVKNFPAVIEQELNNHHFDSLMLKLKDATERVDASLANIQRLPATFKEQKIKRNIRNALIESRIALQNAAQKASLYSSFISNNRKPKVKHDIDKAFTLLERALSFATAYKL